MSTQNLFTNDEVFETLIIDDQFDGTQGADITDGAYYEMSIMGLETSDTQGGILLMDRTNAYKPILSSRVTPGNPVFMQTNVGAEAANTYLVKTMYHHPPEKDSNTSITVKMRGTVLYDDESGEDGNLSQFTIETFNKGPSQDDPPSSGYGVARISQVYLDSNDHRQSTQTPNDINLSVVDRNDPESRTHDVYLLLERVELEGKRSLVVTHVDTEAGRRVFRQKEDLLVDEDTSNKVCIPLWLFLGFIALFILVPVVVYWNGNTKIKYFKQLVNECEKKKEKNTVTE